MQSQAKSSKANTKSSHPAGDLKERKEMPNFQQWRFFLRIPNATLAKQKKGH